MARTDRRARGFSWIGALMIFALGGLPLPVLQGASPTVTNAIPFLGAVKTTHERGSVHSSNLPLTISFFDPDINWAKSSFTLTVDGIDLTSEASIKSISLGMRLVSPLSLPRYSHHSYRITFLDDSDLPQWYQFEASFDTDVRGEGDFLIELEDFNYSMGKARQEANVMPYAGLAYAGLSGVSGVDYMAADSWDAPIDNYRDGEKPNVPLLLARDRERSGFLVDGSYLLAAAAGDWFQYTRNFPTNDYEVYAALSSGSDPHGTGRVGGVLYQVADPKAVDSPIQSIGTFSGVADAGWGINSLVLLQDPKGHPNAVLHLEGPTTLRFKCGAGLADYLLFVPTKRVELTDVHLDHDFLVFSWVGTGALVQSTKLEGPYYLLDDLVSSPSRVFIRKNEPYRFFKVVRRTDAVSPEPDGGD